MSTSVSPRYLLKGAVYALEQCGLLLRGANLLYRKGSYASAVAMAEFAREEFGRWKILLKLRKEVVGGARITIKDIKDHCKNHVDKQEAGMVSIVISGDASSDPGKLVQTKIQAAFSTEEWKAVNEQLNKLTEEMKESVPGDRHRRRMSALYVDPVFPERWKRPAKEFSQQDAYKVLQHAVNDYRLHLSQDYTDLEIRLKDDDPELYQALMQWSDRPELPPPEDPAWPDDDTPPATKW